MRFHAAPAPPRASSASCWRRWSAASRRGRPTTTSTSTTFSAPGPAGADAQVATILGNPDASGEGAIVQVPASVGAEVLYSIAETCDQPDKDRFRYFRGVNNEQIASSCRDAPIR